MLYYHNGHFHVQKTENVKKKFSKSTRNSKIKSDSKPRTTTENDPQILEHKLQQKSIKIRADEATNILGNDLSTNNVPTEKLTLDTFQNLDLTVVKYRIYDVVNDLGKNTISVYDTVLNLVKLAIAVEKNQLATKDPLPSEDSEHNKKYVVKMIFDVSAALGSGTATVSETIGKLIELTTWLSNPSSKVTPVKLTPTNEPEAPKGKIPDPAKAPGPVPTDADAADTKGNCLKPDVAAQNSEQFVGKEKRKKRLTHQGAEGGEGNVTPTVSGKTGASIASVADEKKNGKEGVSPTVRNRKDGKEDVTPAVPNKNDGKESVTPAISNKEDVPVVSGAAESKLPAVTAPLLPVTTVTEVLKLPNSKVAAKVAAKMEDANLERGVLELNLRMNLQGGETSPTSQSVNRGIGEGMILPTKTNSPFSTAAPGVQSRGNKQARQHTQAQQPLQGTETRKSRDPVTYQIFNESQNLPPAQQTPRVGETQNVRESGYLNFAESQTQFPGQPTPQIGKPGNSHEFRYLNVGKPQTRFSGQQFSQANEKENSRKFGYYDGVETQNQVPPQRTQQDGEPGGVDEHSRYYSTMSHDPSLFPIQLPPQGYINGASALQNRETLESTQKPYLSVPLTNIYGGIPGSNSHHPQPLNNVYGGIPGSDSHHPKPLTNMHGSIPDSDSHNRQIPTSERYPYSDPAIPAYSSPHKLTRLHLTPPGSYCQDDLLDRSGSSSSSESTVVDGKSARDTHRGPNDRDGLNNRGVHSILRSRHERPDCHESDRISSSREDSYGKDHLRERSYQERRRREVSHWKEPHEGNVEESQPRQDKRGTSPAHSEELQTITSRSPHQSSSSRPGAQQSFWASYNPFGRP